MNRRDLLKFFGAGAIIAPVAAPEPVQALIVEPPKVELFEPTRLEARSMSPDTFSGIVGVEVYLRKANGTVSRLLCEGIVVDCDYELCDVTAIGDRWKRYMNTGRFDLSFKLIGAQTPPQLTDLRGPE